MKRYVCVLLALMCVLSMMLSGCRASSSQQTEPEDTIPVTEAGEGETAGDSRQEGMVTIPGNDPAEEGTALTIGESGVIRLEYSGNVSSVRYITSAAEMPGYEQLQFIDDAFFQDKALLIVLETVTNGSARVGISGVSVEDGQAFVTLSHEAQGDMTTAVMTTWLIWAEVEQGLDYRWSVVNPALESGVETH